MYVINWPMSAINANSYNALMLPIYARMLERIAEDEYVSADETTLKVQQKGKCRTAWMWTFITSKLVTYVFSASRSGQTPLDVLGQSRGNLQVDGFTGYNHVTRPEGRTRSGCWSHVRRKFFEAMKTAADEARHVLDQILKMYMVEYEALDKNILGTDAHRLLRQMKTKPIVDDLAMELSELCPEALREATMPGWRLISAWPDVPTMRAALDDIRCGKEHALNRILHHALEQGEAFPALELLPADLLPADLGSVDQRALFEVAALGAGHSASENLITATLASGKIRSWEFEKVAHAHLDARRFESARAIFDAVIARCCMVDPDPTGIFRTEGVRRWEDRKDRHLVRVLNNALWAI